MGRSYKLRLEKQRCVAIEGRGPSAKAQRQIARCGGARCRRRGGVERRANYSGSFRSREHGCSLEISIRLRLYQQVSDDDFKKSVKAMYSRCLLQWNR